MDSFVVARMNRGYVPRKIIEYMNNFNNELVIKFTERHITISRQSDSTNAPFHNRFQLYTQYFVNYEFDRSHALTDNNGELYYSIAVNTNQLEKKMRTFQKSHDIKFILKQNDSGNLYLRIDKMTNGSTTTSASVESSGPATHEEHTFNFTKQPHECFVRIPTTDIGSLNTSINKYHESGTFLVYPDALVIKLIESSDSLTNTYGNEDTIRTQDPIDYFTVSAKCMKVLSIIKSISENGCLAVYYEPGMPLRLRAIINCIGEMETIISSDDEYDVNAILPDSLKRTAEDESDEMDELTDSIRGTMQLDVNTNLPHTTTEDDDEIGGAVYATDILSRRPKLSRSRKQK